MDRGRDADARPAAAAAPTTSAYKGMSLEDGRKWWAFHPLQRVPAPKVRNADWTVNPIDAFILEKLEAKGLKPSPVEEKRTLVRRAYVDLVGYKPTFEEVEAFANDASPGAWESLIDRLQASPQYGERWGRHWMDVARFGEDNSTSEATNPAYPFAWRYRDWIIDAVNRDVPYDRFVKLQLAADLMPGTPRDDLRALGYLGAAPIYHKDHRLSAEVIGGFMTDDWDERVDAVGRGLLGLTVSCARCHDHKFDPITTKDYYGLMGVFASTMRAERPMMELDPKVEQRYLWVQNRLFDLRYATNLLTGEASPWWAPRRGGEVEARDRSAEDRDAAMQIVSAAGQESGEVLDGAAAPAGARSSGARPCRRRAVGRPRAAAQPEAASTLPPNPSMNAVYDAAQSWMAAIRSSPGWSTSPAKRAIFRCCCTATWRLRGHRAAAFSRRARQGRRSAEERIGQAGPGGADLHRCYAAGCPGDRESRVGLAFRQAACRHAERLRSAG